MPAPKLVLLTDFSPLSRVAIDFALKMAGPLDAEFTILNVIRMDGAPKANMKLRQIEKNLIQVAQEEGVELVKELRSKFRGNYKLSFQAVKSHTVADMVRRYTDKNPTNMVVMGSRGASALKKAVLGGTTVSVIDSANVPVLAIPEFAQYKNLQKIVYASDLKNAEKELALIKEFADIYGSHVHVIHVEPMVNKKIEAQAAAVEALIRKGNYKNVDFRTIIDDDVPDAIGQYIKNTKADLLTTFTHHLSLMEKLFARSVTRTLAYMGTVPLLALRRK